MIAVGIIVASSIVIAVAALLMATVYNKKRIENSRENISWRIYNICKALGSIEQNCSFEEFKVKYYENEIFVIENLETFFNTRSKIFKNSYLADREWERNSWKII